MLSPGWLLDLRVHLQQLRLESPRTAAGQLRASSIATDAAESTRSAEMAETMDTTNTTATTEIASDTTNVTAQHGLPHDLPHSAVPFTAA